MNNKILEQLDYFRIRDDVAKNCMSQEGMEFLKTRMPLTKPADIATVKIETAEWMNYISSSAPVAIHGWEPISEFFEILGIEGGTLEIENIYALGLFCKSCSHVQKALSVTTKSETIDIPKTPYLYNLVATIPDLSEPEQKIFRILTKTGEIRDLPELQAIRSKIQGLRQSVDTIIHKYTTDANFSKTLQSSLPALRGNRQVLAVKANFRGRIKGIVHEMSQTGQTLYIEPDDIVEKNNALIQEEFRLSQEIRRILKELTAELAEYKKAFVKAHKIMLNLDAGYAAARWGINHHCIMATDIKTQKEDENSLALTLVAARHPLLGEKAVPITVQFHPQHRVLILTGPNTGGKTVTLKTIALFTLLNQSGFPVPAQEGTKLPIFTNIFADIGDEQSLDQSLSTFSGHMKNIAEAINGADEDSLVLLDELGSGTDPQEGGAIAMAVLDELIKRKSFVLVTTHHGILKNFGYTHESCVNASVDFDETTLSPTYRIQMGVPGESHALDIARRSGLNTKIVTAAEKYITNGETDVSKLIKGLNQKHEELAKLEKTYRAKSQQLNEKWRTVDLKDLQLRQKKLALDNDNYQKNREFLEKNRKMLENLVRELREGEITREKTLKVKQSIANMNMQVDKQKEALKNEEHSIADFTQFVANQQKEAKKTQNAEKSKKIKKQKLQKRKISFKDLTSPSLEPTSLHASFKLEKGSPVLIGKNRREATLVQETKNGSWLVQMGSLKITIKTTEIYPDWNKISNKKNDNKVSISKESPDNKASSVDYILEKETSNENDKPKFELRLLGMHYDEALKTLQKQLDLCTMHNFRKFSIIHGKGNGVLQQAVQDYLSHYPGVKDFHYARPEHGGTGKTFVELDV